MNTFTIKFDLKDPDVGIKLFQEAYKVFLTYEHTTSQKTLWREQKKIYDEILNSSDPKHAYEEFRKLDKTTHQLASERLLKRQ